MDSSDRIRNFENLVGCFSIIFPDIASSPRKTFHIHDAYELSLNLSENIALDVNEESYMLPQNSLLLFNTMDLHRIRLIGTNHYKRYVLWFKDEFLDPLGQFKGELLKCFFIRGFDRANLLPLTSDNLQTVIRLFQKIQEFHQDTDMYGQEIRLRLLVGELLMYVNSLYHNLYLEQNIVPTMTDYQAVYRAIQYIRSHLSEKLDQNELSRLVFLDKRQLCKCFHALTGFTTGQYILNCRLTAAKALLLRGESVMTVCEKTGFGDSSNFSRTFRNHVGISPKQYAVRCRNSGSNNQS